MQKNNFNHKVPYQLNIKNSIIIATKSIYRRGRRVEERRGRRGRSDFFSLRPLRKISASSAVKKIVFQYHIS